MKPENPAEGISKMWEYDSSKCFKTTCSCGSDDHDFVFVVEKDEDVEEVMMSVYITAKTDYWTQFAKFNYDIDNEYLFAISCGITSLINSIVIRAKLIYNILIHGYVKYEYNIMMNRQVALNCANAIQISVHEIEQARKGGGE
jgi:hypothetical protein